MRAPLLIMSALLAAPGGAQDMNTALPKFNSGGGAAVAGTPVQLPREIKIKSSPDAPPPGKPETLCENDDFKPADGPCPSDEPGGQRAGLTRAQIIKGRMELSWGEMKDGGQLKVFLAPAAIPFEVEQRLGISEVYKEGSCPYKVTLEHEKLHWGDNKALYAAELSALEADLIGLGLPTQSRPRAFQKDQSAQADAYEDATGQALAKTISDHRKSFKAKALDKVHARDTRDEYTKIYDKCPVGDWKTSEL